MHLNLHLAAMTHNFKWIQFTYIFTILIKIYTNLYNIMLISLARSLKEKQKCSKNRYGCD